MVEQNPAQDGERLTQMTPDAFRAMALALPGAVESSHMGHADFRANGRIFCQPPAGGRSSAVVQLSPEEQAMRMEAEPDVFRPCAGAWGRNGSTYMDLARADDATVRGAVLCAHARAMAKPPGRTRRR